MSTETKVTLSKGGTGKGTKSISKIIIPDLWHIAQGIRCGSLKAANPESADLILECWHLAHDFKRHIQES